MGKNKRKQATSAKGEKQARKILIGIAVGLLALMFLFYMILA